MVFLVGFFRVLTAWLLGFAGIFRVLPGQKWVEDLVWGGELVALRGVGWGWLGGAGEVLEG